MKKKEIILLVLIFLLAVIPRSIEVLNRNQIFGFDQGRDFLAAKEIVFDRNFKLIGAEVGGHGGVFQGPGWFYLLSIPIFFSQGDPHGGLVLMFLISLGVLLSAYFLVKIMFNKETALIVSLLLAVSPRLIEQARMVWAPFPIPFLAGFFLFFLFKVFQKKENFFPLLTFVVGLMFHFEAATGATLLVQLIFLSLLFLMAKIITLRVLLLSAVSFLFPLMPLLIFDLRNSFINLKGVWRLLSGQATPLHQVTWRYGFEMFINHLEAFRFNFLSTFQFSQILWPVLILIFFFGSVSFLREKRNTWSQKKFFLYLLISPLSLFLIFMLYLWPMWEWWLLELPIFYCFLLGIILGYFWRKTILKPLIIFFIFILLASFINQTVNFYKNDFYDFGGVHKLKGKLEAIDYIYKDAQREDFNVLVFTPPVYDYAYRYLLTWYGERRYDYVPGDKKEGLFYLWIEPDPSKPWSYKGWLETVVKTGEILKTVELPSGFIIQKRYEKEI